MQLNKTNSNDIDIRSCTDVLYFCLTKYTSCTDDLLAKEVAKEVGSIQKHLENGLKFYKPLIRSSAIDEKFFKEKNLTDEVSKLLRRLCEDLKVEASVGYVIFVQYMSRDATFSDNTLNTILKSNHATSEFFKRVRAFYREERLSLIGLLALSLIEWEETPLSDLLFAATGKQTRVEVAEMIINQYDEHCSSVCDSEVISLKSVNEEEGEWEHSHVQHFLEHMELLKCLLIAATSDVLESRHFTRLMNSFRSHTLASRSTRYAWSGKETDLVDQLAMYQFLICVHACRCKDYISLAEKDELSKHPMSDSSMIEEFDKLVIGLDDRQYMSPFLLLNSLSHIAFGHPEKPMYARKSIRDHSVFRYLKIRLESLDSSLQTSNGGGGNLESLALIESIYCLLYDFLVLLLQCVHINSLMEEREAFISLLCKVLERVVPMTGSNSRPMTPLVPLLEDLAAEFPDSLAFVSVCAALATEDEMISGLVVRLLQNMSVFSENSEIICMGPQPMETSFRLSENRPDEYSLVADRRPYPGGSLVIPKGTKGVCRGNLIMWRFSYNFWNVIHSEVKAFQHHVRNFRTWSRLRQLFEFARVWMNAGHFFEQSLVLTRTALQIARTIDHPSVTSSGDGNLMGARLAIALRLAALQVRSNNASVVVEHLVHGGLIPVVRRLTDVNISSNSITLECSLFEDVHNTYERRYGHYPVTEAYLELCLALVPPSGFEDSCLALWAERAPLLIAAIYFMAHGLLARLQEERASFITGTGAASQVISLVRHCLLFFTEFLTRRPQACSSNSDSDKGNSLTTIQDLCIVSLISPSVAECLIALTSVKVEFLETRRHMISSMTVEPALSRVVWLALTLMGQLLDRDSAHQALLRRMEFSGSPGHHYFRALLSFLWWEPPPAAAAQRGPPLAAMALSVLRRAVHLSALPVLPCLGEAAGSLRKVYLRRLAAWSEDDGLRAVMLDLLSEAAVSGRPGLLHLMAARSGENVDPRGAEEDCVTCVHSLLERRQECSFGLQLALFKFFDSVWQAEATAVTRRLAQCPRGDNFWKRLEDVVIDCVQRDPKQVPNLPTIIQILGHVFSLFAMEVYQKKWAACDPKCQETLRRLLNHRVFVKWLELLDWSIREEAGVALSLMAERLAAAEMCFSRGRLLFLVLLKASPMQETSVEIEFDFLQTLTAFYETLNNYESETCQPELTAETLSLLTIFIHRRISRQKPEVIEKLLERLVIQLSITRAKTEVAYSSHMDLLSSITQLVQNLPKTSCGEKESSPVWDRLLVMACDYVNLLTLKETLKTSEEKILSHSLILLTNILPSRPRHTWSTLLAHSLNNILFLLQSCLSTGQRPHLAHHILLLLHTLISYPEEAQILATYDLPCLLNFPTPMTNSCSASAAVPASDSQPTSQLSPQTEVLVLTVRLVTSLLTSLGRQFFPKAAAFLGAQWWGVLSTPVHRWPRSLDQADLLLSEAVLHLVWGLAEARELWPLHLPEPLMINVSTVLHATAHRCTALLLRPKLLQHQLEVGVDMASVEVGRQQQAQDVGQQTPVRSGIGSIRGRVRQRSRSNSSRTSSIGPAEGDLEQPKLRQVEYWLFRLLTVTLSTFNRISPRVSELVGQPFSELAEFGCLIHPSFATPGLQEEDIFVNMGVLVSVVHLISKMVSKTETRSSPGKSSTNLSPDDVTLTKTAMMIHCQEETLSLLMSQAVLTLNSAQVAPSEKQNLYRELSAELTSFLSSTGRHLRRSGVKSPAPPDLNRSSILETGDSQRTMHRCVENFLKTVVK